MAETGRYRARSVVVDAFRWPPSGRCNGLDVWALNEWAARVDIAGRVRRGEPLMSAVALPIDAVAIGLGRFRVEITSPNGPAKVQPGDLIVCAPDGSFHPCKPGLFTAMFEPIAEEPS